MAPLLLGAEARACLYSAQTLPFSHTLRVSIIKKDVGRLGKVVAHCCNPSIWEAEARDVGLRPS